MYQSVKFQKRALLLLISLPLACFALLQNAEAIVPPPDGGYPGQNTAEGSRALYSLYNGTFNTADGYRALYTDYNGSANVGIGSEALYSNQHGNHNTAVGDKALFSVTDDGNTAVGWEALANSNYGANTALGSRALFLSTNGSRNTAVGTHALSSMTWDFDTTAVGYEALLNCTTPDNSTAVGSQALHSDTTGYRNTAIGSQSHYSTTTGFQNIAIGTSALQQNTIGNNNIAIGYLAGFNLTTGDGNILIGVEGYPEDAYTIRIGLDDYTNEHFYTTYIAGIWEHTIVGGRPVVVDEFGQLGVAPTASPAHASLERGSRGSKRRLACYEALQADLLKAQRKMQQQASYIAQLKINFECKLAEQQEQIQALTSGLQKVNAQIEVSKSAPQTVLNNQ